MLQNPKSKQTFLKFVNSSQKMEILDQRALDADCTVEHFAAMADIFIRRPHLIKSRKKLVAGAKIVHLKAPVVEANTGKFLETIQSDFRSGKFNFDEEDFCQAELDYSKSFLLIRKIIYKNSDMKDTNELLLWNVDDGAKVLLHVVPLDITEPDDFSHTKLHYCVTFDSILHQVRVSAHVNCYGTGQKCRSFIQKIAWF
jgi:hypothetical protein